MDTNTNPHLLKNWALENYELEEASTWEALVFIRVYPRNRSLTRSELMGWVKTFDKLRPVDEIFVNTPHDSLSKWGLLAERKLDTDNTPLQTAMRALKGAGLRHPAESFQYVGKSPSRYGRQWRILFEARISRSNLEKLQRAGDVGQRFEHLSRRNLYARVLGGEFSGNHWRMITEEHPLIIVC